jgi:hypothetical protein
MKRVSTAQAGRTDSKTVGSSQLAAADLDECLLCPVGIRAWSQFLVADTHGFIAGARGRVGSSQLATFVGRAE